MIIMSCKLIAVLRGFYELLVRLFGKLFKKFRVWGLGFGVIIDISTIGDIYYW